MIEEPAYLRYSTPSKAYSITVFALSAPTLAVEPVADCSRYDTLKSSRHVH